MAAVKRFVNVTGFSFTPAGGPAVTLDGVREVRVDPRARSANFAGDLDRYPTQKQVTFADPVVTADAVESGSFDGVAVGTRGVLTWVAMDAAQGSAAGGGAKRATVATAVFMGSRRQAKHRKRAGRVLTFETLSPDGQADPVQWAAL